MAPGMLTVYPQHPTSLKELMTHLVIPALAMDAGSSIQAGMDNSYSQAEDQSTMASNLSSHRAMHHHVAKSAFVNHPSTAEIEVINRAIDRFTKKLRASTGSSGVDEGNYLRLHAPAIAHAFGLELAKNVKFSSDNDQLHMVYRRSYRLQITTSSQLEEALRRIRSSWIHRLALKRRVEYIRATKPHTTDPLHSARQHVAQYLWIDPQARKLCDGMKKALSLVTSETWQAPGRWRDLQAELEKLWWKVLVEENKLKNGVNSEASVTFKKTMMEGPESRHGVYWQLKILHSFDIINRICAKLRQLPDTSPFVRAPFTIEEFDPFNTPTRDGDVTRYADTLEDPDDEWVRISGKAFPGDIQRALVCPARTMIAAVEKFCSTIDLEDFKKLEGYIPEEDWHARLFDDK